MKVINIFAYNHNPKLIYGDDGSVRVSVKKDDVIFISGKENSDGSQQAEIKREFNGEIQILDSEETAYQLNITKI